MMRIRLSATLVMCSVIARTRRKHREHARGRPSGIGAATAKLFAAEGARVAVVDWDSQLARDVATAIGAAAIVCTADVRNVAAMIAQTQAVPMTEPMTAFTLEAPGGLIRIQADCRGGRCNSITLRNVPSFVLALDQKVGVGGVSTVMVDIAHGGMMYAIIDARARLCVRACNHHMRSPR